MLEMMFFTLVLKCFKYWKHLDVKHFITSTKIYNIHIVMLLFTLKKVFFMKSQQTLDELMAVYFISIHSKAENFSENIGIFILNTG